MAISTKCPRCGKVLKVRDEAAGKKGKCPGCGELLIVPSPGQETLFELKPRVRLPKGARVQAAKLGRPKRGLAKPAATSLGGKSFAGASWTSFYYAARLIGDAAAIAVVWIAVGMCLFFLPLATVVIVGLLGPLLGPITFLFSFAGAAYILLLMIGHLQDQLFEIVRQTGCGI